MPLPSSASPRAVAQAFAVTLLWATSWVLIKCTLPDVPPPTFAALRYCLAALCLVPLALLAWLFLGEGLTWRRGRLAIPTGDA